MTYLSPDTTAILVADRRSAREAAARRRRSVREATLHRLRRALLTASPARAARPVPTDRTPVGTPARAA